MKPHFIVFSLRKHIYNVWNFSWNTFLLLQNLRERRHARDCSVSGITAQGWILMITAMKKKHTQCSLNARNLLGTLLSTIQTLIH